MHRKIDSCLLNNPHFGIEGKTDSGAQVSVRKCSNFDGLMPCSPSVSLVPVTERPSTTLNSLEQNFDKSQIITHTHGARERH